MRGRSPSAGQRLAGATLVLALCALGPLAGGPPAASGASARPNVLLIVTDDQTVGDLYARVGNGRSRASMRRTLHRIGKAGVTFARAYASNPISCPSRSSILTGQYSFNHGIRANVLPGDGRCSDPGRIDLRRSLPVWLKRAGYRTYHYGRFLNAWGAREPTRVAPGWDRWVTAVDAMGTPAALYYGYHLNEDGAISGQHGRVTRRDERNYFTDVITEKAMADLTAADRATPFFVVVDHRAPHEDLVNPIGPEPAVRHAGTLRGKRPARPPSFNEGSTRDKAPFLRRSLPLSRKQVRLIKWRNRRRLESLRAVDDSVGLLLDRLRGLGELDETYVLFVSDHGFFNGEHRVARGKRRPYEPATRIPLLIRGPGIPAGATSRELVANVDIAPTILGLAGAGADRVIDGRSLLPFARRPGRRSRRPILLEGYYGRFGFGTYRPVGTVRAGESSARVPTPQSWKAIVSGRWKLIRYGRRNFELYDLRRDPHELRSLARRWRYKPVVDFLDRRLQRLGRCRGRSCRRWIRRPPPPLPPRHPGRRR